MYNYCLGKGPKLDCMVFARDKEISAHQKAANISIRVIFIRGGITDNQAEGHTSPEPQKQLEQHKSDKVTIIKEQMGLVLVPFLAPSGAQGVTIFVRSSVRQVQVCLLQVFINLAQVSLT